MIPLLAMLALARAQAQERVVESVVAALAHGPHCSSRVELSNLSDRAVVVDVEAHRASGALVPLTGRTGLTLHLSPREISTVQPRIEEEGERAWVKVREHVPSPALSPSLAIAGTTECIIGDQLRGVARPVVYPTDNPWFSGDVTELPGDLLSLINTSERPVRASLCYSSGGLYSTPAEAGLRPICGSAFDVRIPPFGSREFALARDGSSHFSIKTQGAAIVLEMLRPVSSDATMYAVDSSIQFGAEVPAPAKR